MMILSNSDSFTPEFQNRMNRPSKEKIDVAFGSLKSVIDGGSKNLCPTASGSSTAPTRWFDITNLSIPAGDYVFSFGTMTSTDTDTDMCRGVFYGEGGARVSDYFYIPRGTKVSAAVKITSTATSVRINPAETLDLSTGDTLAFTNAMICKAEDWRISEEYAPYCPTLYEVYQMVLDLQESQGDDT